MSFGFGIGDVLAIKQLLTETSHRLDAFSPADDLNRVTEVVLALATLFHKLEGVKIVSLPDAEIVELGEITRASIDSINGVDFQLRWMLSNSGFGAGMKAIERDELPVLKSSVARLEVLLGAQG